MIDKWFDNILVSLFASITKYSPSINFFVIQINVFLDYSEHF